MIEFQTVPDPIFLAIFNKALTSVRSQLVQFRDDYQPTRSQEQELDDSYENVHPELVPFFSRRQLVQVIDSLLEAGRAPELYRLTDYHWLVVYRCIEAFCDLHNYDLDAPELPKRAPLGHDVRGKVGPYIIDKIDFDYLEDRFFFDTDFLLGSDFIVARERSLEPVLDVSSQPRKIAAGLKPDLADLELRAIDALASLAELEDEKEVPESGYVGPYPMREPEEREK